tara:strand:- start:294 stop:1775 length:1482 start_codon:yes stop_codon:yes gene_type:complete
MNELKLPKLKKVDTDNPVKSNKKKILLLSDDIRMHSGIATMSREFVMGTLKEYDWVQIGGAVKHPEHGKIVDMNQAVRSETGIEDASLKIYPVSGYGNPMILRSILDREKPDAIMHYTDPRFWAWLYQMERELRQKYPLMYYTIWDDLPYPRWNEPFYESCDSLQCISKQTHNIVKNVCREEPKEDWQITYIPHGINENDFYPITSVDPDYGEFKKFKSDLLQGFDAEFVVFYNNRNIRRKGPGDIVLAYKEMCDKLPREKADKCLLLMHTAPIDENGTDLPAVVTELCKDKDGKHYEVLFSNSKLTPKQMNYLYNIADVQINMASNEGFGLSGAEALMTATPIVNNVTGGLQDHCGFELKGKWLSPEDYSEIHSLHDRAKWKDNPDLTWGKWCKPIWPGSRSLQGSPMTPYIFDDRPRWEEAGQALFEWYEEGKEKRKEYGELGREYAMRKDVAFSAKEMCNRFIKDIDTTLEKWTPRPRFETYTIGGTLND